MSFNEETLFPSNLTATTVDASIAAFERWLDTYDQMTADQRAIADQSYQVILARRKRTSGVA